VLTVVVFVFSIAWPDLRILPYLMFGGTFLVALSYMIHAKLEPQFDTVRARLLVTFLALAQPLVRGWWRYYTWLKYKRTPAAVIEHTPAGDEKLPADFRPATELRFWNEEGHGREVLLAALIHRLETGGWSYSIDTGWQPWDVQIYGSFWWGIRLHTVTEYHGGPKCLTRVRLTTQVVATTVVVNFLLLVTLGYRQVTDPGLDLWWQIPYVLFLGLLFYRAARLKGKVARLVALAAGSSGLSWVSKRKKKAPVEEQPPEGEETTARETETTDKAPQSPI
jgi:hypothetical protein